MSNQGNSTTNSAGFNEYWYKAALENRGAQFERDFEKAFIVPAGAPWIFAPAVLFPAVEQAENALLDFGRNLLADCLQILQSFNGTGASDFIRGELGPRFAGEIRDRKKRIRERPCLTCWDADDVMMILAAARIDELEKEIANTFEIEALKREPSSTAPARNGTKRQPLHDVDKRRLTVKRNSTLGPEGLCASFDKEGIPLTRGMSEAGSWTRAWKSPVHRHAIEELLRRDRAAVKKSQD